MNDTYIVYVHITPNNKKYVGLTKNSIEDRSGKEGKNYKGQVFYYAIKKYSWNNIQHIILKSGLSREDACFYEKYYIQKFKSFEPDFGYNLTLGGEGTSGYKLTREQILKKIQARKGYKHSQQTKDKISKSNKNKIITEEQRQQISNTLKKYFDNIEVRKKFSNIQKEVWKRDGHKEKMSNAHKGYVMPQEQKNKIAAGNLGKKQKEETKNKLKNIVKLQHEKERLLGIKRNVPKKQVAEYSSSGEIICIYESQAEAARKHNIEPMCVSECCRGVRNDYKGLIFKPYKGVNL